jgi:hypothetical protein
MSKDYKIQMNVLKKKYGRLLDEKTLLAYEKNKFIEESFCYGKFIN